MRIIQLGVFISLLIAIGLNTTVEGAGPSRLYNLAIEYYDSRVHWQFIRDFVFVKFLWYQFTRSWDLIMGYGVIGAVKFLYDRVVHLAVTQFMALPSIKTKVDNEVLAITTKLESDMIPSSDELTYYHELPRQGWTSEAVLEQLHSLETLKHSNWEKGRVSGAVYHGGEDLLELQAKAYNLFGVANQLHPDVFPGVRKMESEIVSMVLKLYNAPTGACGTSTSGGTESLLLACLSAKKHAFETRGVTDPEIVAPITVHAGFDKAAYYFGIKLHHAPIDPITYQVDILHVKRLINANTVLLVGSAPNFPHGIIDDIPALGALAQRHNIPLHVDACLGSFIMPFLEPAGLTSALFDFRVPGVTSVSCDTHKYGFAPKGSSVIMYRNQLLRASQYFVCTKWSGGIYGSPTLAGSRPGALMAGCWATMMTIGYEGYLASCLEIVGAAQRLKAAIRDEIGPHLQVLGDPIGAVIAFKSDTVNIYDLADSMKKLGWHLSALQKPAAIHVAVTKLTVPVIDDLIRDLKDSVNGLVGQDGRGSAPAKEGTAALYGVAGSVKTAGVADRLAVAFLDNLYKLPKN
ncbi:PLP-dependent transferase [Nadsonia fulvescens var. elongata DSM 6958]|uniref:sphinganine-1-phosphate aldolase n=1 Tax=Nadsonia fulvescens var. elongata DSM 6958 TaxID=857566 RepID=A0A1E3PFN9_9ASCO|nr:PLP-dependent transferase [Nadsonia fulvescens var. elongata DSM 6958]